MFASALLALMHQTSIHYDIRFSGKCSSIRDQVLRLLGLQAIGCESIRPSCYDSIGRLRYQAKSKPKKFDVNCFLGCLNPLNRTPQQKRSRQIVTPRHCNDGFDVPKSNTNKLFFGNGRNQRQPRRNIPLLLQVLANGSLIIIQPISNDPWLMPHAQERDAPKERAWTHSRNGLGSWRLGWGEGVAASWAGTFSFP